jgi:YrbI family 3-deoxy-D-manno-octulosonate 8-phosphate phosphatase
LSNNLENIKGVAFDFDGVFTDNRVYVSQDGVETVVCDRADGLGISMLHAANIPMVIISTETNPVVNVRGKKLSLKVLQGIDEKLPVLIRWASEQDLHMDQVAYVGNDINDLECLREAGVGVVVADAYSAAIEVADLELTRDGGRGAVREFSDLLLAELKDN